MKIWKSIYWILFLLTAMLLGPFLIRPRDEQILKPRRLLSGAPEQDRLMDALGSQESRQQNSQGDLRAVGVQKGQ